MPDAQPEHKRPRRQFDESLVPTPQEEKSQSTPIIAGLVLMTGLAISLPMLYVRNVSPHDASPVPISAPTPEGAAAQRHVQDVEEPSPAPAPLPRIVAGNSGLVPLREVDPIASKNCDGCTTSQAPQSYAARRYAQPPPSVSEPAVFAPGPGLNKLPSAPPPQPAVPPGVVQRHDPAQFKEMCDRLYLYKVANDTGKDWTNITVRADSGESWTAARLAAGQTMDVKTSQPTGWFDISGSQAP